MIKKGIIAMLNSVEGIYKNGKIELLEQPPDIKEARVIVTFLPPMAARVDLRERGIDEAHAAELRGRLKAFAEDWDREEMDAYNAL